MEKHGSYLTDEGLEVEYSVWEDSGDWFTPPSSLVEIKEIKYNGINVTNLLFEIADEYIDNIKDKIKEDE